MASRVCARMQVASGAYVQKTSCTTRPTGVVPRARETRVGAVAFLAHGKRRACVSRRVNVVVRATMGDADAPPMTVESATKLLGVRENASFDEIMRAKNRLAEQTTAEEDLKRVDQAYDTLLMQSFKNRQSGKVMDKNVKYADVQKPQLPDWTKKVSKNMPNAPAMPNVSMANLDSQNAKVQQGVFAALLAWSLLQGLSEPRMAGGNIPATQLALAFALSVYFLRDQKRLKLSRAALLTTGGLVGGAVMGGLLQSWLRVDVVPIGPLDTPEVLVSEVAILAIWATCTLLA
eukprot:1182939-Prorocentrum_minimum.AAC.2